MTPASPIPVLFTALLGLVLALAAAMANPAQLQLANYIVYGLALIAIPIVALMVLIDRRRGRETDLDDELRRLLETETL